jgi:hypothetical protein
MATVCNLALVLGYSPLFGVANPMPEGLCDALGTEVGAINFHVMQIGEQFYEVKLEYINVSGANANFDFTESVAGKIGTTHRLTYGRHLQLISEGENLLHVRISKD